jgi:GTP-binding protein
MIIKSTEYIISSPDYLQCPKTELPEYAFIGRSNVGKSSLINMISDNHKLAKISGTPGKTQLINHFLINKDWWLVDLPGYGFAKASQFKRREWEKMIEDYLRKRANLVHIFILIDSRHSPQKIDLQFVNQLGKWGLPFSIVFTKTDKTSQLEQSRNVKDFFGKMRESWQFLPAYFLSSTVRKTGREKILEYIGQMNHEYNQPQTH